MNIHKIILSSLILDIKKIMETPIIVLGNNELIKKSRGRPKGSLNKVRKPSKNAKVSKELNYIVEKEAYNHIADNAPVQNSIVDEIEKQFINKKLENAKPSEIMEYNNNKSSQLVETFGNNDAITKNKLKNEEEFNKLKIQEDKLKDKKDRIRIQKENKEIKKKKKDQNAALAQYNLFNDFMSSSDPSAGIFEDYKQNLIDNRQAKKEERKAKYDALKRAPIEASSSDIIKNNYKIYKARKELEKLKDEADMVKASNTIKNNYKIRKARQQLQDLKDIKILQGIEQQKSQIEDYRQRQNIKQSAMNTISSVMKNKKAKEELNKLKAEKIQNAKKLVAYNIAKKIGRDKSRYVKAQLDVIKEQPTFNKNKKLSTTKDGKIDLRVLGNKSYDLEQKKDRINYLYKMSRNDLR
jgi:hypothetical protein